MSPGIETKTATGGAVGIVTMLITWALVSYVPAFRTGLPPTLAAFLPGAVAWVLHTAASYLAPHTPRLPVPAGSGPTNVKVTPNA